MSPNIYTGTLYFDDESSDRISVHRLIVRDGSVSFHFVSAWNGVTTRIEIDGTAEKGIKNFESNSIIPKPIDAGFYPVTITINEIEEFGGGVYISGVWKTKIGEVSFSGDLEPFK